MAAYDVLVKDLQDVLAHAKSLRADDGLVKPHLEASINRAMVAGLTDVTALPANQRQVINGLYGALILELLRLGITDIRPANPSQAAYDQMVQSLKQLLAEARASSNASDAGIFRSSLESILAFAEERITARGTVQESTDTQTMIADIRAQINRLEMGMPAPAVVSPRYQSQADILMQLDRLAGYDSLRLAEMMLGQLEVLKGQFQVLLQHVQVRGQRGEISPQDQSMIDSRIAQIRSAFAGEPAAREQMFAAPPPPPPPAAKIYENQDELFTQLQNLITYDASTIARMSVPQTLELRNMFDALLTNILARWQAGTMSPADKSSIDRMTDQIAMAFRNAVSIAPPPPPPAVSIVPPPPPPPVVSIAPPPPPVVSIAPPPPPTAVSIAPTAFGPAYQPQTRLLEDLRKMVSATRTFESMARAGRMSQGQVNVYRGNLARSVLLYEQNRSIGVVSPEEGQKISSLIAEIEGNLDRADAAIIGFVPEPRPQAITVSPVVRAETLPELLPSPQPPVVPVGSPLTTGDYSFYVRELDNLLALSRSAGQPDVKGIQERLDSLTGEIKPIESKIPQNTLSEIVSRIEAIQQRICDILEAPQTPTFFPATPIIAPEILPSTTPSAGTGLISGIAIPVLLEPGAQIAPPTYDPWFVGAPEGEVKITPEYFGQQVLAEVGLPNLPEAWVLGPGGQVQTSGAVYYVEEQLVEPLAPTGEAPRGLPTYYPSPEFETPVPYADTDYARSLIEKIRSLIERMMATEIGSMAWVDLEEAGKELVRAADDLVALGSIAPEVKLSLIESTDSLYQRVSEAEMASTGEVLERRPMETILAENLPDGTMPGNIIQPTDVERFNYFSLPQELFMVPGGGEEPSAWALPAINLEPLREATAGSILLLSDAERMASGADAPDLPGITPTLPFSFTAISPGEEAPEEKLSVGGIALLALAAWAAS